MQRQLPNQGMGKMTPRQTLESQLRKIETRSWKIASKDGELSDDERTELKGIVESRADLNLRLDSMPDEQPIEQTGAAADRELVELRSRVSAGRFIAAAVSGRDVASGSAEGELRAAEGILDDSNGVAIPWSALAGPVETRANETTTSQHDGPLMNLGPVGAEVLDNLVSEALGVRTRTVGMGRQESTVIASGSRAGTVAEKTARAATQVTFSNKTFTPTSLRAVTRLTNELLASAGGSAGSVEQAIRSSMVDAIRQEREKQIIAGNGAAPNVTGIAKATDRSVSNPGATNVSFSDFAELPAHVDGKYANGPMDISAVVGPAVMNKAIEAFHSTSDATNAYTWLKMMLGSFVSSNKIPVSSSIYKDLLCYKAGGLDVALAVHWGGVTAIRDIFSGAAEGVISLTLSSLWDFSVIRADAFLQLRHKVA